MPEKPTVVEYAGFAVGSIIGLVLILGTIISIGTWIYCEATGTPYRYKTKGGEWHTVNPRR